MVYIPKSSPRYGSAEIPFVAAQPSTFCRVSLISITHPADTRWLSNVWLKDQSHTDMHLLFRSDVANVSKLVIPKRLLFWSSVQSHSSCRMIDPIDPAQRGIEPSNIIDRSYLLLIVAYSVWMGLESKTSRAVKIWAVLVAEVLRVYLYTTLFRSTEPSTIQIVDGSVDRKSVV